MQKNTRRRILSVITAGITVSIAGCADPEDDQSSTESTTEDDSSTSSDGDDSTYTERDDDTGDSQQETASKINKSQTQEIVLSPFDLPDNFSHLNEDMLDITELEPSDPNYSQFTDKKINRQHTNEFITDDDSNNPAFLSSRVFISESKSAAKDLKQSQIDDFSSAESSESRVLENYNTNTTFIKDTNEEGQLTQIYIGQLVNVVIELLMTENRGEIDLEELYLTKVFNIE